MSEHPSRQLADWWMDKTAEERQVFLQDSTAATRQNLVAVEAYCATHSYRVFVESETPLSRRQLGCHVFSAEDKRPPTVDVDDQEEEEVKPHGAGPANHAVDGSAPVLLPSGASMSVGSRALLAPFSPLGGVGARPRGPVPHDAAVPHQAAAVLAVERAQARLSDFLVDAGAVSASEDGERVAGFLVRLLQQAATAAAYRLGIPEVLEKNAQAAHRRLTQRQRRVLLVSKAEVEEAAAAAAPAAVRQTVARPVGARANDLHGFLGLCLLTRPLLAGAPPRTPASRKRPRPSSADTAGAQNAAQAWADLREELSAISLPGVGGGGRGMTARPAPVAVITEQDVLFALHHMTLQQRKL